MHIPTCLFNKYALLSEPIEKSDKKIYQTINRSERLITSGFDETRFHTR